MKLKLSTLLPLVGTGLALVNPKVWMNKPRATALVAALLATLLQVLKLYDIDLPLDHETLLALAGLVVTGVLYARGQRDAVQAERPADPGSEQSGVPRAANDEPEAP